MIGSEISLQLVLPEECRTEVLYQLHDQMGHLGIERTLNLLRSRFYWPRMSADVQNKIKTCERCIKRKAQPEKAAPLVNIKTTRPLELVCMDFLSLEPDRSKTKDILVMTDHFTKYAGAVPTPNQKAKTVAKCLWENLLVHYGIPEKLHSDQGPDFESRTIKELCEMAGISKIRTTPYHPRGNPVERFNRTLLDMLGTLKDEDKTHWKDFVKPLVHAYNCTRSDVTGYSPYELMFGRQPRLPIDLAFGLPLNEKAQVSHCQYVDKLKAHLEESYRIAAGNAEKVMQRNKTRFDKNITASELAVGDRVLVRNVRLRGKHKIADRWESEVYVVTKRAGDLPVYTVKPETKDRPIRTLHRDLLLPCGYLFTPAKSNKQKVTNSSAPVIPDPLPDNNCNDTLSEDELSSPDLSPPITEPIKYTSVIDLPASRPSVPAVSQPVIQPGQQSQLEEKGNVRTEEAVEQVDQGHREVEVETDSEHEPPEITANDPTPAAVLGTEDNTSCDLKSPKPVSIVPESYSPSENEPELSSPECVSSAQRPTRTRRPPDRLQYSRLGHPLLHSIQSLFHGLSTAFNFAFELEEEPQPLVSNGTVCCQSVACTGPYMS